MLSFLLLLALLAFILLIIGVIKPKWIVLWKKKDERTRKTVLIYFGNILLWSLVFALGFMISWIFFFMILVIILGIYIIISFFIGMAVPTKVFLIGDRTRKRILIQYSVLFVLFLSLLIVVAINLPDEIDERIPSATYEGEYSNGFMHGQGRSFNNSSYYEGDWINGERNGQGVELQDMGLISIKYDGEWKDDLENGQGIMTIKFLWVEMKYEGELKDGNREGYGKFIDRAGNIYEGEWLNDAPNGKGKSTLTNGDTYEGEFKDWQRQGYGKAVLNDGEVLEGNWVEDELVE
ncbi:hypothetical protein FS935_19160 [Metabacillus litoralis]|uniref:Uncharacterized protein n=1 Tax=Metabacillus litoralis TaxID=152268 RepID=A0A5C6VRC9_9BACI|nr:hypothetical protein [Metabacillus litoralis]TXC85948.1 hypothetical protein FS935_19160 [Metabacillus litoralis]